MAQRKRPTVTIVPSKDAKGHLQTELRMGIPVNQDDLSFALGELRGRHEATIERRRTGQQSGIKGRGARHEPTDARQQSIADFEEAVHRDRAAHPGARPWQTATRLLSRFARTDKDTKKETDRLRKAIERIPAK